MNAVRTTASGMTIRGKWILRTRFSRSTIELIAAPVASPKKVNSTMPSSSTTAKCSAFWPMRTNSVNTK